MKKHILNQSLLKLLAIIMIGTFLSCESDEPVPKGPIDDTTSTENNFVFDLNWDGHENGNYSEADAEADFGDVSGWDPRVEVKEKELVVTLLANKLSGSGGIVADVKLTKSSEYRVTYDVKFPDDFEWGRGGKVGFGFRIGDGNTGCNKADDGNGGSARLMWYTSDNGRTRFKPYLYYKDMPDNCGDNLVSSAAYPESGSLEKGKWYTIVMHVKSNTRNNKDGFIKVSINGQSILDENIRWTTNNSKRLINELAFSTFRGGSQDHWKVDKDTYVHFDNLKLERLGSSI